MFLIAISKIKITTSFRIQHIVGESIENVQVFSFTIGLYFTLNTNSNCHLRYIIVILVVNKLFNIDHLVADFITTWWHIKHFMAIRIGITIDKCLDITIFNYAMCLPIFIDPINLRIFNVR